MITRDSQPSGTDPKRCSTLALRNLAELLTGVFRLALATSFWVWGAGSAAQPAAAAPAAGYQVISRGEAAGTYHAFPDVCRLKNGDLLCVFYGGYDHVSLPRADWPKGGRICSVRSIDEGRTWSAPRIVFDGPLDDRDPHVAQMADGTVVCSFFTRRIESGGKAVCDTWS